MLDLADIQVTSQSPILLSTSLRAQEPDLWTEAGSQGQLNGTVDGEVDVSWLWWNLFSLWDRLFILDVYFTEALLGRAGRVWLLLSCTCHSLYLHVARIHACWWYVHVYFLHSSFTLIFLFAGKSKLNCLLHVVSNQGHKIICRFLMYTISWTVYLGYIIYIAYLHICWTCLFVSLCLLDIYGYMIYAMLISGG